LREIPTICYYYSNFFQGRTRVFHKKQHPVLTINRAIYCHLSFGLHLYQNDCKYGVTIMELSPMGTALHSVIICVRERPQTFGNLANHSSPITERSRSFANKTAYWNYCWSQGFSLIGNENSTIITTKCSQEIVNLSK